MNPDLPPALASAGTNTGPDFKALAICATAFFACPALLALILSGAPTESAWERFARERNCKVVAETEKYHTGNMFGRDSWGGEKAYQCDDGITYWRRK